MQPACTLILVGSGHHEPTVMLPDWILLCTGRGKILVGMSLSLWSVSSRKATSEERKEKIA